jgi:hypothetical protein
MSAGIASAVGPDTTTVLEEAFEGLSVAVVLLDDAGAVRHGNALAHSLFGDLLSRSDARCCDLVSCGRGDGTRPLAYHCVASAALERGDRLTGLGFSFAGRPMEVSATPLSGGSGVVLELTAGVREQPAVAPIAERLEITTLGAFSLRCGGRALGGAWLHHRPGQVLRYLLCSRGHSVAADEIVEAIWPDAGRAGLISLRQAVHVLRDRLEPDRPRHVPSRFIIAMRPTTTGLWANAIACGTWRRAYCGSSRTSSWPPATCRTRRLPCGASWTSSRSTSAPSVSSSP